MGRHLRGRSEPLGMPGSFEPGPDDSLQRLGLRGIGGSRYRVCATGPGRVVVGRAGAGVRVSGAGVVQHDFGCFCGGDCWIASGAGVS